MARLDRVRRSTPYRAWVRFLDARGITLARGLAFQQVFATFAGLWLAFAIAGFWLRDHTDVQAALVRWIDTAVPGLVDAGSGGAVRIDQLLRADILSWSGGIAAVVLLWTVISWFSALRESVRLVAGLPRRPGAFAVRRLWDALMALGFGAVVAASVVLSVAATTATDAIDRWIGLLDPGLLTHIITIAVGVLIAVAIDVGVTYVVIRFLAGTGASRRSTIEASLLAAVAFTVLKVGTGLVLRGSTSNPLLAPFVVIVGLMLWFFLHCTVLLIAAALATERDADRVAARLTERLGGVEDRVGSNVGGRA